VSKETILLVIKFKIGGSLRFLSHAETLKLFQRACVRTGIDMQYSRGFNPRPKMSLPLPRTVGVKSEDDVLCLRVNRDLNGPQLDDYRSRIEARIAVQLPDGCELLSVEVAEADVSFQPTSATYILSVTPDFIDRGGKSVIERLMQSNTCNLQRRMNPKNPKVKNVNVRPFLKSIEINDRQIMVECKISPGGTIRVEEILKLLELDEDMFTAPITRTSVRWQVRGS
jgi:radical SAM-linked protein